MKALPRLHLVTDDTIVSYPGFVARATEAIEVGGAKVAFHLRGPRTSGRRLWDIGRELVRVSRESDGCLIVNDRLDVAIALGADGAHLRERSLPAVVARDLLGSGLLGRSVHSTEPAERSREPMGAQPRGGVVDYLHAGTVFRTPSHPEEAGMGVEGLRAIAVAHREVPVLAIGGVTAERIGAVLEVGAYGVAVVRAVWDAPTPGGAVVDLVAAIEAIVERGRGHGGLRRPA